MSEGAQDITDPVAETKEVAAVPEEPLTNDAPPLAPIFGGPPIYTCEAYTLLNFDLAALRARGPKYDWASFLAALTDEMRRLELPTGFDPATITYAIAEPPDRYGNGFNERALRLLLEYDAAVAEAKRLQEEHDAIEAARPPEVAPEVQYDENGEEIPPKPKKRREIRAEKEARRNDLARFQGTLDAHYNVQLLEARVKNIVRAASLRVEHRVL